MQRSESQKHFQNMVKISGGMAYSAQPSTFIYSLFIFNVFFFIFVVIVVAVSMLLLCILCTI